MPINLKCPACGGPVYFEPQSGKMKCRYCSRETDAGEFSRYDAEPEQDTIGQSVLFQENVQPSEQQQKHQETSKQNEQQQMFQEKESIPGWKRRQMEMWGNEQGKIAPQKEQRSSHKEQTADVQSVFQPSPVISQQVQEEFCEKNNWTEEYSVRNKNENTADMSGILGEEYMELNEYHCTSCGAKLMLNGTEASTFCGFCGSPTIVFDRVAKQLRPQKIIPFKITEAEALDNIKKRFQRGKHIPVKIRELTVEKVRGIYIPFWLYDSYIRRSMNVEVYHDEKRYHYYRDASCTYKQITMDASLNLNNSLSQRLEPYNLAELEAFEPAYLSGYYADIFDVPKESVVTTVQERCRNFIDLKILESCHGVNLVLLDMPGYENMNNYKISDVNENFKVQQVEYALLPAYFINISYKDGNELVLVNGQTGKVVGNLPIEKAQIAKIFTKYAIISGIVMSIVSILAVMLGASGGPMGGLMLFAIPSLATFYSIWGGGSKYKKYKMDRFRMNTSNMRSYVDDREEGQL